MKKTQHNLSKLKHQLFQMRNAGKKNPIWKLDEYEVEFITRLGFTVIASIYRINTRTFVNIQDLSGIFKEIHFSKVKNHKNVIFKKLRQNQVRILRDAGVKVVPYKYEIKLRN